MHRISTYLLTTVIRQQIMEITLANLSQARRRSKHATILFCWELGGGLGHVVAYLKFADELSHRGHRLVYALRQTGKVARLLQQAGHTYLQAPLPDDRPNI